MRSVQWTIRNSHLCYSGTLQKTFAQHVMVHPQVPNYHAALELHLSLARVLHHTLVRRHFLRVKYPCLLKHGTSGNGDCAKAATPLQRAEFGPLSLPPICVLDTKCLTFTVKVLSLLPQCMTENNQKPGKMLQSFILL